MEFTNENDGDFNQIKFYLLYRTDVTSLENRNFINNHQRRDGENLTPNLSWKPKIKAKNNIQTNICYRDNKRSSDVSFSDVCNAIF